jgi:hypothetical protein
MVLPGPCGHVNNAIAHRHRPDVLQWLRAEFPQEAAMAEPLELAERAGLDLATVLTAVGDGAGTSRMFEVRGPAMAAQDYAGPGVQASVFDKDISIITGFASPLRSPTPLFSLASTSIRRRWPRGTGLMTPPACTRCCARWLLCHPRPDPRLGRMGRPG